MATFPLQDQPFVLPSGRIVRIYNLLSLTQSDDLSPSFLRIEPSFRVQYGTTVSADQPDERVAEAGQVIAYFLGEASAEHPTVAYAEICTTPAQAARRDSPEASFEFRRDNTGAWRLASNNNRVLDQPPNER